MITRSVLIRFVLAPATILSQRRGKAERTDSLRVQTTTTSGVPRHHDLPHRCSIGEKELDWKEEDHTNQHWVHQSVSLRITYDFQGAARCRNCDGARVNVRLISLLYPPQPGWLTLFTKKNMRLNGLVYPV